MEGATTRQANTSPDTGTSTSPEHNVLTVAEERAVGKMGEPARFEFKEIFTYEVKNGKYGGYDIPINLPKDHPHTALLREVAEENGVALKLYGRDDTKTLYLKCDQLNSTQRDELLGRRNMMNT